MSARSKCTVLFISTSLVLFALVGGMMDRVDAQTGSYQQLSIFSEVLNRMQGDYVDEPSVKLAFDGAIRGLIESVDVHGGYLNAKEVEFYKSFSSAKGPGIGATLSKRFGYPIIVATVPGGAADQAGLKTGDMLESIDGHTARELNLVQVLSLLSSGKPVKLSVVGRRRSEPQSVEVKSTVEPTVAIETRMLASNIAYLKVPTWPSGRSAEVRKQLDALMKRGAQRVILDLRSSAGGDDQEGYAAANLFIESGSLGYLQGQRVEKKSFLANPKDVMCKLPLIVLVNQGTAGAAEIAAAAIADNARGQLLGMKTFGMASSQKLFPVEEANGLLLTVSRYYTPTGKEIHEVGIRPSVEVPQPDEEPADPNAGDDADENSEPREAAPVSNEDRQLNRAIEILGDPAKAVPAKKAA